MRITSLQVRNYRCFEDTGTISTTAVNLIVGKNNVGKSSLLKAIFSLQVGGEIRPEDLRIGSTANSGGFRTPIPIESGHPFRGFRTPEEARRPAFV